MQKNKGAATDPAHSQASNALNSNIIRSGIPATGLVVQFARGVGQPKLLGVSLAVIGLLSTAALYRLDQRGRREPALEPQAAVLST